MKTRLLLLALLLVSGFVSAQVTPPSSVPFENGVPQGIKYQAVVRDQAGDVVADKNIKMKISIRKAPLFSIAYQEEQTCVSNKLGLVDFVIGTGTPLPSSPAFKDIKWGEELHYVQLEIDIASTGYTNLGNPQLLSVPYAFHSATSTTAESLNLDALEDRHLILFDKDSYVLQTSKVSQTASVGGNDTLKIGTAITQIDKSLFVKDTVNISSSGTLRINDYTFPNTAGTAGQILSFDATTNALVWETAASFALRSGSDGASIVLDTNGTQADSIAFDWERSSDGKLLRNRNEGAVVIGSNFPASTTARLHVEQGDFVVTSTDANLNPPYDFGANTAGIMWWGKKNAFRVGSNSQAGGWNSTNIGQNSIGLGRNITASGDYSFGIGDSILVANESNFGIGKNITVKQGTNSFSIGNNIRSNDNGLVAGNNSFSIGNDNVIKHDIAPYTLNDNFVLGNNNWITDYSQALLLGEYNRLGMVNSITGLPTTVMIGGNNAISVSGTEKNTLIGTNNQTAGSKNFILGDENKATIGSIVIGQDNDALNPGTLGHTVTDSANIIIGSKNRPFAGVKAIVIGSEIGNHATYPFSGSSSINIGHGIFPNTGATKDPTESINIGNKITPRAYRSINIGHDIQSFTEDYTITIGSALSNDARGTILIGSSTSLSYSNTKQNMIVLGSAYETAYSKLSAFLPRFVVGHYFPDKYNNDQWKNLGAYQGSDRQYNLLLIDEYANAYFGSSDCSTDRDHPTYPASIPTFPDVGRVFARSFHTPAGELVSTSDEREKNTKLRLSGDFSDALYDLTSYSYYYNFQDSVATPKGNDTIENGIQKSSASKQEPKRPYWGFMAQDVKKHFPHLVYESEKGTLSLNYIGFIPILWKISQDQQLKITEQQSQIEELQQNDALLQMQIEELQRQIENINRVLDELKR